MFDIPETFVNILYSRKIPQQFIFKIKFTNKNIGPITLNTKMEQLKDMVCEF